jgi:large subunit ribosomal protein L3
MAIGIFAKKIGMTQIFDESGTLLPVTILKSADCKVSQIKTLESDGYNSVQIAYNKINPAQVNRAIRGHLKKSGGDGYTSFSEFRINNSDNYKLGQTITLDIFNKGQKVRVTGKSIGKGFAGNQKRHNFSRGPMTHGSKNHRLPGSIGAGSTPGRVYPGKKMAGQLGNANITLKNTEILYINSEENILVVKGSIPGKPGNLVNIKSTK